MLIAALVLVVVYVYAIYPAVLTLIAAWRSRRPSAGTEAEPLSISLVVCAHNEERNISAKAANCIALEYSRDRLEIVVASDGSTDNTVARALRASPPVRVVEFKKRRGKTAVLNDVLPTLTGDIIVHTDANSELAGDALLELVKPFSDPLIGCVVGRLAFLNPDDPTVSTGEGLYWRYEDSIKRAESQLGVLVAANGGIYALRKTLITAVPQHIASDAVDPLLVASHGYRVCYQPTAVAYETASESYGDEFRRKVRIVTRGFAAFTYLRGMLVPLNPRLAIALISHKLLRWVIPWILISLLVACLMPQAPHWAHVAGWAQVALYALGVLGLLGGSKARRIRPIGIASYFCLVNAAAAYASLKALTGFKYSTWERGLSAR